MNTVYGIAAAPGIAFGKVHWLQEVQLHAEQRSADHVVEQQRLETAREAVHQTIRRLIDNLRDHPEETGIFVAHEMMLDDPDLLAMVESELDNGAEYAWENAIEAYARQMEALNDDYFKARAADIRDIGRQVMQALNGKGVRNLDDLAQPVIILARDLTPSETGSMDKAKILGFATLEGSSTSHTAILARSLGIPAVLGIGAALNAVQEDEFIILNGSTGEIIVNPEAATRQAYYTQQEIEIARTSRLQASAQDPAVTRDGKRVEIVANIGNVKDAANALEHGAEGVGLLRTEFLYMNRSSAPSEEEQFKSYQSILEIMGQRPVVIRTMDIGGDKSPSYMDLGQEANPFLGWRAIRVCLDTPDFFKTQLRAILRASLGHDVRIMFPMIATLEELRAAKALLAEAQNEIDFQAKIQVGMMVEIPSVVQMADLFSQEIDFFSIGTNDLTQYTFAVDRTNNKVAHLADACHPAILRQIRTVIEAAHAYGHWVGACGELAGDPDAIPVLLGLGLDEFSMSPSSIPTAKEIIRSISLETAKSLAAMALGLGSAKEVRGLVRANH